MAEKTLKTKTAFKGKLLKVDVVDVELGSGLQSKREIVRHPGAAAVLCENNEDGRYVLVRQYRKPAERELLEVVAGTLEPDEDPEVCARREVQEETGFKVKELTSLGAFYLAPGYSEELLHAYHAIVAGTPDTSGGDEDEDLDVVFVDSDELDAMIGTGKIQDAKTIAIWHLVQYR